MESQTASPTDHAGGIINTESNVSRFDRWVEFGSGIADGGIGVDALINEQLNPATDEAAGVAGDPNPDLVGSVSGNVSDNGNWGADGFGRITQVQIDGNAAVAVPQGGSVTVYWSETGAYLGTAVAVIAAGRVAG